MKRNRNTTLLIKLTLALILLIAIPACGIAEEVYMHRAFDGLCEECDMLVATIESGDRAAAIERAHTMEREWKRTRDMLEFLYPNADVKEIQPQIGELIGDLSAELDDDAIARAEMISSLAENGKNLLSFKWKNIL